MNRHRPSSQRPCLSMQPLEYRLAHAPVDFDPRKVDEVRELAEFCAAHVHVELERCGVGMNGDDGHLSLMLVEEEAVRDELRHVVFHKRRQTFHGHLEFLEFRVADRRGVDVDDWLHSSSLRCRCGSLTLEVSGSRWLSAALTRAARGIASNSWLGCMTLIPSF